LASAHVFHVHPAAATEIAAAVVGTVGEHGAQRADPGRGLQGEIDEARPRHLGLGHQRLGGELLGERLGERPRLQAGVLGQHHGGVGRHVAVRGLARRLDHDARLVDAGRQHARRRQGVIGGAHALEHQSEDVRHFLSPWVPTPCGAYRNSPVESKRQRRCFICAVNPRPVAEGIDQP
jgi:hypothetical protein